MIRPQNPDHKRHLSPHFGLQSHKQKTPVVERMIYALLTAIIFSLIGILSDLLIALVRSLINYELCSIFWIFTPLLLVVGAIIGACSGNLAGINWLDGLNTKQNKTLLLNKQAIRHDIFRVLTAGLFLLGLIWVVSSLLSLS